MMHLIFLKLIENEISWLSKINLFGGFLIFNKSYTSFKSIKECLSYINTAKNNISMINQNNSKEVIYQITSKIIHPIDILISILFGANTFDSSYAFELSEKGFLLNFNFQFDNMKYYSPEEIENENIRIDSLDIKVINLTEPLYRDDNSVLVEKCECFSCKTKYTKAYINHLFKCNELNGHIILLMHNIYMLECLIKHFEKVDEKYRLSALINFLKQQTILVNRDS